MSYDSNNPFAKILRGELPAHVVEETPDTLTFMDLNPHVPGHSLVIPKESCTDILEISSSALNAVIQQTKRIAEASKRAFQAEGVMILQLNGAGAGQSVFHLHFHVMPKSDGILLGIHGANQVDATSLHRNAEKIQAALAELDGT